MAKKYPLKTVRQAWGAGKAAGGGSDARWAFSQNREGLVEYLGRCISENGESVDIECLDAMAFQFGIVANSGRIERVSRDVCQFFTSEEAMLEAVCQQIKRAMVRGAYSS